MKGRELTAALAALARDEAEWNYWSFRWEMSLLRET